MDGTEIGVAGAGRRGSRADHDPGHAGAVRQHPQITGEHEKAAKTAGALRAEGFILARMGPRPLAEAQEAEPPGRVWAEAQTLFALKPERM